jgi:excisionase family DNA binding protein
MTVAEAAKKIGISVSLTYELCRLGTIRHSRHGRPGRRGTIRISPEAVAEYLANAERRSPLPDDSSPLKHLR